MTITEHIPLAPYTTLGVGGEARYVAQVTTVADLEAVRQFAIQAAAPLLVLGAGSNVLVNDDGFDGVVIINQITGRDFRETNAGKVISTIGAGELLDDVVADTVARGYWGLENLSHIPGTVGATPVQNVGAYGVEVSDRITLVDAIHIKTGEVKTFTTAQCQFAYRDSYFKTDKGRDWVITSVTFALSTTPTPVLTYKDLLPFASDASPDQQSIRDQIIRIRSHKFPDWTTVGTAGSFFKNPIISNKQAVVLLEQFPDLPTYPMDDGAVKVSLGYILDKVCNLRGFSQGDVGLYEDQAMVLVNYGQSAQAVHDFVETITRLVREKTGITIEQEVRNV